MWQPSEANEWAQEINGALGDAAQPPSPGADPSSLGDATATARLLDHAGFDQLRFEDVREPVFYGRDIDDAVDTVRGFQGTTAALAELDSDQTKRAIDRLRGVLAAHYSDQHGVVFDSRSWLITAYRRGR